MGNVGSAPPVDDGLDEPSIVGSAGDAHNPERLAKATTVYRKGLAVDMPEHEIVQYLLDKRVPREEVKIARLEAVGGKGLVKCPRNHPCRETTLKQNTFQCELCSGILQLGGIAFKCRKCKWDCCLRCATLLKAMDAYTATGRWWLVVNQQGAMVHKSPDNTSEQRQVIPRGAVVEQKGRSYFAGDHEFIPVGKDRWVARVKRGGHGKAWIGEPWQQVLQEIWMWRGEDGSTPEPSIVLYTPEALPSVIRPDRDWEAEPAAHRTKRVVHNLVWQKKDIPAVSSLRRRRRTEEVAFIPALVATAPVKPFGILEAGSEENQGSCLRNRRSTTCNNWNSAASRPTSRTKPAACPTNPEPFRIMDAKIDLDRDQPSTPKTPPSPDKALNFDDLPFDADDSANERAASTDGRDSHSTISCASKDDRSSYDLASPQFAGQIQPRTVHLRHSSESPPTVHIRCTSPLARHLRHPSDEPAPARKNSAHLASAAAPLTARGKNLHNRTASRTTQRVGPAHARAGSELPIPKKGAPAQALLSVPTNSPRRRAPRWARRRSSGGGSCKVLVLGDKEFAPGDRVTVLKGSQRGKGTLHKYLRSRDRWAVVMDSGRRIAASTESLEKLAGNDSYFADHTSADISLLPGDSPSLRSCFSFTGDSPRKGLPTPVPLANRSPRSRRRLRFNDTERRTLSKQLGAVREALQGRGVVDKVLYRLIVDYAFHQPCEKDIKNLLSEIQGRRRVFQASIMNNVKRLARQLTEANTLVSHPGIEDADVMMELDALSRTSMQMIESTLNESKDAWVARLEPVRERPVRAPPPELPVLEEGYSTDDIWHTNDEMPTGAVWQSSARCPATDFQVESLRTKAAFAVFEVDTVRDGQKSPVFEVSTVRLREPP